MTTAGGSDSVCYGTTAKGKLEHGCKFPCHGENFTAYSLPGWSLGRTSVKNVREGWNDAFKLMAEKGDDEPIINGELISQSWDNEEWEW